MSSDEPTPRSRRYSPSPTEEPSTSGGADLGAILEGVGIAVMTIDAAGRLRAVNEAAVAMFGYPREALLGENVALLMPEHHARRHDGYIRRHIETGERRVIGRGRKVHGLRADGSLFPMHLAVGRFDVGGEPFFTGIVHDLSEPERDAENAIRLGRIVDESVNEVYVFTPDALRITLANRRALENLGHAPDVLIERRFVDLMPRMDAETFERLLAPLRRGDSERARFHGEFERADGSRYDVEAALHLSDAGPRPEFVAIVQDVTERRQMLEAVHQSQKMDAIGQLTGGIAHDFNNLLTVIGGNLELLETGIADAAQRELVTEAREATRMGAALTSRLLSFARRSSLAPKSIDLNELVVDLSDLLRRTLGERLSLRLTLSPRLWRARVDRSLAENAIMNLALNARDAMGGGGTLDIATENRRLSAAAALGFDMTPGDYVALVVSDTGHGIEAIDLPRVFEPFFTTRESGGHGLGLSMVYGFARQSGGHVTVASAPGEGATFTLLLPRAADGAERPAEAPVIGPRVRTLPQPRRRILVVEDDERLRRLTIRRLRHLGHETLEAADGPTALERFRADPAIDLLFVDMIMPGGLSGLDVARKIRAERPDLPVLIASGYAEALAEPTLLEQENLELLKKPYDGDELADVLRKMLSCGAERD